MLHRRSAPKSQRSATLRLLALLTTVCVSGPLLAGEIHEAAQTGDLERVQSLLAAEPAQVNVDGGQGTPLHAAVFGGHGKIVEYLLANGADPDAREPRVEFTALHLCVYSQNLELGEPLVAAGADVNARNRMGLSPMDLAVLLGRPEAVAFLIAHGADIEGMNGHEHRPLTHAASSGQAEIVRMLLEAGADIEAKNGQGQSAVIAATVAGHAEIVELLLARGASVDVKDDTYGRPLLHHASLTGHLSIVAMIVAAGADVNEVDADDQTALLLAARYGHRQVAELLLAHGARRSDDLQESYGRSPHLDRKLPAGEAVAWYLNHRGWAVKTRGRLLVFDAEEFGVTRPADPALANGFLSAEELAGENLIGLYTCYHGDPGELAYVHELADQVAGATYIHLQEDSFRDGPSCHYLAPGEKKKLEGATVRTIDADAGMPAHAYLVDVDGLTIYYQGFDVSDLELFKQNLDRLLKQGKRVDLAFLPIPEPPNEEGQAAAGDDEPFFQILAKLRPRAVCLLDPDRREALYPEVARRMAAAGYDGEVFCAEHPGDHYVYHQAKAR